MNAMDLTQTGWGVLFASDADPAIQAALQPLIDWRKEQVKDDSLFAVFNGADGVQLGQKAGSWADSKGVSLVAPVSPSKGVPYYLLIVGSPQRIPFGFQQLLDLQWAVGRLYFDSVDDYRSYAQKVIDYEKGLAPPQTKRAAVWMPRNENDLSTPVLVGTLGPDFLGQVGKKPRALGQLEGFQLSTFIGEGQATKDALSAIFRGTIQGGRPSVLFTGSHGAEWPIEDPSVQRQRQGALITQEWKGQPLDPGSYFAAADLSSDAAVHGLIYLMFACFGGGCPAVDSYLVTPGGVKVPLTPEPFVTALPQKLLGNGALAVIAHVDRAFSYAFQTTTGTPQPQLLRTVLELIMRGQRVGMAADPLNLQWSVMAAQLGDVQEGNDPSQVPDIGNLFVAREDARNYLVLGDPAVCLRANSLQ
jgi:hypothetical protein